MNFQPLERIIRGWPRCARCNNLVDRVTATEDYMGASLVLTVECHGASEEIRIPMSDFQAQREPARFGDAFVGAPGSPVDFGIPVPILMVSGERPPGETKMNATAIMTYPIAAAATPERSLARGLTHAVRTADYTTLCGRVKPESILDDGLWGGEGCTERPPTCKACLKRDPRRLAAK